MCILFTNHYLLLDGMVNMIPIYLVRASWVRNRPTFLSDNRYSENLNKPYLNKTTILYNQSLVSNINTKLLLAEESYFYMNTCICLVHIYNTISRFQDSDMKLFQQYHTNLFLMSSRKM